MATIEVIDLGNITVDGVNFGRFTNLQWNCGPQDEGFAGQLFDAVQAWVDERDRLHAEALATAVQAGKDTVVTALADRDAVHAADLDRIRAAQVKELGMVQAQIAPLQAQIADQVAQITALGGTELGQRLAKEAKIRAAEEAVARAQADLAALGGSES